MYLSHPCKVLHMHHKVWIQKPTREQGGSCCFQLNSIKHLAAVRIWFVDLTADLAIFGRESPKRKLTGSKGIGEPKIGFQMCPSRFPKGTYFRAFPIDMV